MPNKQSPAYTALASPSALQLPLPPPPTASTSHHPSSAARTPASASTSASPPALTETGNKKRKKLPSCDACKLRRVLCMPQPVPGSCPRCTEKGIVCTTTPVVRKKPAGRTGKRIEEAKAIYGTADASTSHLAVLSSTPWLPSRVPLRIAPRPAPVVSSADIDSRLGLAEVTGVVAAHLIELYQHVPQSWLPLFPRGRLVVLFELAGRRLDALPPQTEVLAHTIIALTARLSAHPFILGPSPETPPFESITPAYLVEHPDLREFGARREAMCEKLREKAIRIAWERGTLVESSEDSMACCHLLEVLEGRTDPKAGKPYGSAFVSHLRTLLDETDKNGAPIVMQMGMGWSALLMREALYAATAGRTSHFTAADDLILCGQIPPAIEEALLQTVDGVDVRDSTMCAGLSLFVASDMYHVARLARECSDRITGTYARRQPLDEPFITKFLTQLDHLFNLLSILDGRISFVLSPAATTAHALPAPFETERQYIMRMCVYTLQLAWCSLSLPVYVDVKRRIEELKTGNATSTAERRRTSERLHVLLQQVHRTTLKAARMVASCVHGAPSLAFLTHLQQERLEAWVEVLMAAVPSEEGGEGITLAEKATELHWMLNGLKTMGWSWAPDDALITSLASCIEALHLQLPSRGAAQVELVSPPAYDTASTAFPDLPMDFSGLYSLFLSPGAGPSGVPFDLEALLGASVFPPPAEEAQAASGMFDAAPGGSGIGNDDWMTM